MRTLVRLIAGTLTVAPLAGCVVGSAAIVAATRPADQPSMFSPTSRPVPVPVPVPPPTTTAPATPAIRSDGVGRPGRAGQGLEHETVAPVPEPER